MALALNNLKRVDMPLNQTNKIFIIFSKQNDVILPNKRKLKLQIVTLFLRSHRADFHRR